MGDRVCPHCKEANAFYSGDSWCKECSRIRHREYRQTHKEQIQKRNVIYREANKEKMEASEKKYHVSNPHRHRAHGAIANAIRRGAVVRGCCDVCGDPSGEAHHHDYDKPLDVRWLCRSHHKELHRIIADAERIIKQAEVYHFSLV